MKPTLSETAGSGDLAENDTKARTDAVESGKSGTYVPQDVAAPFQYMLFDRRGKRHGPFSTMAKVHGYAELHFPGEKQDEDRTGKGWDVEVWPPIGRGR